MRAAAMAELGKSDDEDEDDGDDDEGLNNPADYVAATWQEHRLHHTYPQSDGYDNQDPSLMHDWGYLTSRFNWWFANLSALDGDDDALFDEPGGDVKGWQEL